MKLSVFARSILLACALFFLPQTASAADEELSPKAQRIQNELNKLGWIEGPKLVNIGSNAEFTLKEGYSFLNPTDTRKLMQLMQNPMRGSYYYFGPIDMRWQGLFLYEDTGHIADDDDIDADALLDALKKGTEMANIERKKHGWATLNVDGWAREPHYDSSTNRLEWAIVGSSVEGKTVNFNTRFLGRTGVMSVTLVVDPEDLDAAVKEFNDALKGFNFKSGSRYSEYREGDKTAQYGLAALVAGGAAAVAAKKGFFAAFWKLIVAGVIAIGAVFVNIFRRKKSSGQAATGESSEESAASPKERLGETVDAAKEQFDKGVGAAKTLFSKLADRKKPDNSSE